MTADSVERAVIGCTPCASTWEVDASEIPDVDLTCCPGCGGWTFLAEVLEPDEPVLELTTARGGELL